MVNAGADILKFSYLPEYALFLRDHHLMEFVRVGIDMTSKERIPLVEKFFARYSQEQLLEISRKANFDLLSTIGENQLKSYIEKGIEAYQANRIPDIDQQQILAEDIVKGWFIRRKLFRHFLPQYTDDWEIRSRIMDEMDDFNVASEMAAFNAFISIQQERMREVNEQLRESSEQLLEAQELAGLGSFIWNLESGGSSFTRQVSRIFGTEKFDDLLSFMKFVHPGDLERLKASIDRALNGEGPYECEYRYVKDGTEKMLWSRGLVVFKEGKPSSMKGTIMDVTQQHQLNQELIQLNQSLSQKNQELLRINHELDSFNYVASHDLQEPLRKILLYISRMEEKELDALPDTIRGYLEKIMTSAKRMQKLIEDLLNYSQSTPSEQTEELDLNKIISDVKSVLSDAMEEKLVSIGVEKLPVIRAIPFQFHQLFTNLISNSLKYAKSDVPLVIRINCELIPREQAGLSLTYPTTHYLRINFADNGIGFDQIYAEKIFEPFQRLHSNEQYSGTGIGLALCKRIMDNHDGAISASGEPDKGSVFSIYIPEDRVTRFPVKEKTRG